MRSKSFLSVELHAHSGCPLVLRAVGRNPDDRTIDSSRFACIEQTECHGHVVAKFVTTVGGDEYPAVADKGHVRPAKPTLALNREFQRSS